MIGTDFETFLSIGGKLIPVPESLEIGDKHGQHVELDGGTMHRDNVMVELCPNPSNDPEIMADNILGLTNEGEAYLSKVMGETVSLSCTPSVFFGDALATNSNSEELGCDRDFLALHGHKINRIPPSSTKMKGWRGAGGHVHLSYDAKGTEIPAPVAVHLADLMLGTLEVMMGKQGIRREFYGMGGLFRPRNYGAIAGVEYRTPSNLWVSTRERIVAMATNALSMEKVMDRESPSVISDFLNHHWPAIQAQNTIMNENKQEALGFLVAAQDAFPSYKWKLGV